MGTECCPAEAVPPTRASFDDVVLPHLQAGRQLARWLMRNEHNADDVVQEASLRAFRYFRTFSGGNGRAWFLRIVRNTCSAWRGDGRDARSDPFDEEQHRDTRALSNPEVLLLQSDDATLIARALRKLPAHFHHLLVLRELEGLSYRELADVIGIPIGTVMSRLSRAREALRGALDDELTEPGAAKGSCRRARAMAAALRLNHRATRNVREVTHFTCPRESHEQLQQV
jgi:RNA polymerase sigma-70 factor (ECF subfamily)